MSSLTASSTSRRALGRAARLRAIDLGVVTVLLLVGVQAFGPVFGGAAGYVAAGGGVAIGLALGVVSHHRQWTKLGTLVVAMVLYLALGGALALRADTIAGVVPTLTTLERLVLLSWQSWRDLLTVSLPAGEFDGPTVMPFLAGLVAATLSASFVLRLRRKALAVLPAFGFLVTGILWGSHEAPLAAAQGAVFAAACLGWLAWRSQLVREDDAQAVFHDARTVRVSWLQSLGLAAAVIAVAGGIGTGLAAAASDDSSRHVLRDDVVPPLDLRAYPSPLTTFRDLESREDETLFTIDGLPAGARVRLAAMDVFDGNVYSVSEESARFVRAGSTILPTSFSEPASELVTARVTIGTYDGVWLPGGGDLRGVDFTGAGSRLEAAGLFYNPATGTALTTVGVAEGSTYAVDVAVPAVRGEEDVAALPADASLGTIDLGGEPVQVDSTAAALADLSADATTPMDQLRSIERGLQQGAFADGEPDKSLAGHTTQRIDQLLASPTGQMVGDDEQYAVAMALMARSLGMPARVVMGFYPAEPVGGATAITGADAHVWVEVLFDDLGWVDFDPTPDDQNTPDRQQPQPQERNDPQVLPPPEVPEKRELKAPPKADADESEREQNDDETAGVPFLLKVAGLTAGGVGLASLPFVAVLAIKGRRRQKRRHAALVADRISGAWAEIADTATDLGDEVPRRTTRLEVARALRASRLDSGATFAADAGPEALARSIDTHVWGPEDPSAEDAERIWSRAEALRAELYASLGRRQRLRARLSLRSLRRPSDAGQTRRPLTRVPATAGGVS